MIEGKIGVILSQINGTKLTIECINSIKSSNYDNLEFYVGDNYSDNYEHLELLKLFPEINLFTYQKRKTYCETFNYLSKIATNDGCEFIFIINNDTRNFSTNYFHELLKEFEKETVGLVGSNCLTFDGEVRQDINSMKNKLGHSVIVPTEGYLVRAKAWTEIGGFDENLNIYTEDLSIHRKLLKFGWGIKSNYTVSFEHLAGATISKMIFHSNYFRVRNGIFTLKRLELPILEKLKQAFYWCRLHIMNSLIALKKGKLIMFFKIVIYSILGIISGLLMKNLDN